MKSQSSVVRDLEMYWNRESASVDRHSKDAPSNLIDLLLEKLERLPGPSREQVVEYLEGAAADYPESDFVDYLVQALVVVQLEEANREGLRRTLSACCPRTVSMIDTEYYVVRFAPHRLEDPVLVFVDAFKQAEAGASRNRILQAMKRAFRGLVQEQARDSDFVEGCAAWYEANRSRISIDPEYAFNRHVHVGREVPLFQMSKGEATDSDDSVPAVDDPNARE